MSYPSYPSPHRNGEPRDMLAATMLGLALMAILTTWWWYVMR